MEDKDNKDNNDLILRVRSSISSSISEFDEQITLKYYRHECAHCHLLKPLDKFLAIENVNDIRMYTSMCSECILQLYYTNDLPYSCEDSKQLIKTFDLSEHIQKILPRTYCVQCNKLFPTSFFTSSTYNTPKYRILCYNCYRKLHKCSLLDDGEFV